MEFDGVKYKLLENTGVKAMCEACVFGSFNGDCENIYAGKLCGTGDSYFVREAEVNTGDRQLTIPDVSNLAKFCNRIAKQEDCPPEFIEIVNKEFWNLI